MPGQDPQRSGGMKRKVMLRAHVRMGKEVAGKSGDGRPIFKPHTSEIQARAMVKAAVDAARRKSMSKAEAFRPPRDEVVRAIASRVTQAEYKSRRRTRWGKIVHTYCREYMGYADKGLEVEEFVYIGLKQTVDLWKKADRAMKSETLMAELEKRGVEMLKGIEKTLVGLTKKGSHVKADSPHQNYRTVMATLGRKTSRKVFIIFKDFADREPEIMSLKNARDFRKGVRHRFTRRVRMRRQEESFRRDNTEREARDFYRQPRAVRH